MSNSGSQQIRFSLRLSWAELASLRLPGHRGQIQPIFSFNVLHNSLTWQSTTAWGRSCSASHLMRSSRASSLLERYNISFFELKSLGDTTALSHRSTYAFISGSAPSSF